MKVGFDIDGTVDENPPVYQSLMSALKAAGHQVIILTGCSAKHPTQQDVNEKTGYLKQIGLGCAYDRIVVFGDPPHKAKAKWIRDNNVDLLVDNSVKNAQLAAKYTTVLLPWNDKAD